ncbi:MAG: type VI secretion system tube protein Hcp [Bryobacteraceae bacterium]
MPPADVIRAGQKWIKIIDVSFGRAPWAETGSYRVTDNSVHITRELSAGSVRFARLASEGLHIDNMLIEATRRAGNVEVVTMHITLEDVNVTAYLPRSSTRGVFC